jgi:DNA-binding protein HU-beta
VNKAQLIEAVSSHYAGSKAEATKALNAVVQTITQQTAAGEKVSITGFGVFERVPRPARMVRNPRTGERKRAKATAVPRFRAGSELKAYVSGEKKLPKATAAKTAAGKTAASKTAASPARAKTGAAKTARPGTAKTDGAKTAAAKSSPAKKTTARKTSTKTAQA